MKRYLLILLLLFYSISSFSQTFYKYTYNNAFKFGEEVVYKVKYSLFINVHVGEFIIKTSEFKKNNKSYYNITANGNTYKFYDAFFKVRDMYKSLIDVKTFRPVESVRIINEGDFSETKIAYFHHDKGYVKNNKNKITKISSNTQDILSTLFLARTINYTKYKKGQKIMFKLYLDEKEWVIGLRYDGIERKRTRFGKINCFKITPILIVDRVFKADDDMTIWITADKNKLPVFIKAGISVGSVEVDLFSFKNLKNKIGSQLR